MSPDFDTLPERRKTASTKWDFIVVDEQAIPTDLTDPRHGPRQLLPLWVADMDFPSPTAVADALIARARHGVFGYTIPLDGFYDAVIDWQKRRNGWAIERDWITLTPGVVSALYTAVRAFTEPGDGVLIQRPVYHPFIKAIEKNDRVVVSNSLSYADGRYTMDFDDLARKTADPAVKLALLCHPHNPVGRVWTAEELRRFGKICRANDVLVVSDELHGDLLYGGRRLIPFATLGPDFADNVISCVAPSKTFNLAGLKTSTIIIPNAAHRAQFETTLAATGIYGANAFGIVAAEAAYRHGEPWLAAVMAYVEANYRFLVDYLARHLPLICPVPPEGTYLVWLDCRHLGLTPVARKARLFDDARVYLGEGEMFGPEGADFERINIACPRPLLATALDRMRAALAPA